MTFEAEIRDNAGLVVVDLHGEVDGAADEGINGAYQGAISSNPQRVLLSFNDVSYINSTGIALIVGLLAEARAANRSIIVCGLTDHYKEIFEITRIADFVTIVDDEAAATATTG